MTPIIVDYNEVKRINALDSLTLTEKMLKLSEETGEATSEFLAFFNAKNASKSAIGNAEELTKELLDVIIVAKSALVNMPFTEDELNKMAGEKLAKWESKATA